MKRVTIRMKPNAGVVGEDRQDWLGDTEHECSESYARHLVNRGLATIVELGAKAIAPATASIESRDPRIESQAPAIENRDPDALTTENDAPAVRPPSPRNRRG